MAQALRTLFRCLVLGQAVAIQMASAQGPGMALRLERETPMVPGKRWAVIVGAGKYEQLGPLQYAPRDAADVADVLIKEFGFQRDTVRLITDETAPLGAERFRRIRDELDAILRDARLDESDLFVFFFSGHGVATPTGDYLLPTDAKPGEAEKVGIQVSGLLDRIAQAGLKNVLFLVDACRTGAENRFGEQLIRLAQKTNIAVLLGCEPGGRSYEDRRLEHGLFTHFLLDALRDKDLVNSQSGGLWATAVADAVRQRVKDYSERDNPAAPQTPHVWAYRSADVLLGAYLGESASVRDALDGFLEESSELSPGLYVSAAATFAEQLLERRQYAEAAEVLRAAERFGEPTDRVSVMFGVALAASGRLTEAERSLERVARGTGDSVWREAAVIGRAKLTGSFDDAVLSAERLWILDRTFSTGLLCAQTFENAEEWEKRRRVLTELLELEGVTPRRRSYVAGQIALDKGLLKEAAEAFYAALDEGGRHPSDREIYVGLVSALVFDRVKETALRLIRDRISEDERDAFWHLAEANALWIFGERSAIPDSLSRALRSDNLTDYIVLESLFLANVSLPQIADDVIAAAERFPLSWRAQLARDVAERIKNPATVITIGALFPNAERTVSRPEIVWLEFARLMYLWTTSSYAYRVLNVSKGATGETEEDRKQRAAVYRTMLDLMEEAFVRLVPRASRLGKDRQVWTMLLASGLWTGRFLQVDYLIREHVVRTLRPSLKQNRYGQDEIGLAVFTFYLNTGRGAEALSMLREVMGSEEESRGPRAVYGLHLAVNGDYDSAREMLKDKFEAAKSSTGGWPSRNVVENWERWATLLIVAGTANMESAREFLSKEVPAHPTEALVHGIAWAAVGYDMVAFEFLLRFAMEPMAGSDLLFVKVAAIRALAEMSERSGSHVTAVAVLRKLSDYAGNRLVAEVGFEEPPRVESFAGEHAYDVQVVPDEGPPFKGSLTLSIDSAGAVSGALTLDGAPGIRVAGSIDKFGNFRATAESGAKVWEMYAKFIPPAALLEAGPIMRIEVIKLLDESGRRSIWFCEPRPSPVRLRAGGSTGVGPGICRGLSPHCRYIHWT
ncbi:MAG: caspase family protein [Armatimonadetes bacterium]|nr:caspase family protein [Armatimonadota bacterium]